MRFRMVVFRNRKATTIKILVYDSCEASDYVKLKHGNSVASGGEQNRLHITRRSSEGFKPVQNGDIRRQAATADSEASANGPTRSKALRFVSRSIAAYRLVVSTLACPSQWLIVTSTTPSLRNWTVGPWCCHDYSAY